MEVVFLPEQRPRLREPFCCISHGAGAILWAIGTIALIAAAGHRALYIVSFVIYGLSLVLLYTSSAVYHGLDVPEKLRDRLMRLDHSAIYLLIAGTYTPVCLLVLRQHHGYSILTAQYILAAIGITVTFAYKSAPHWVRVTIYLLMGWMIVVAMGPLTQLMPHEAVVLMYAGGLAYTIGTVVFATNRPHLWPGKFSAHDLWHVFVLAGSAFHFCVMYRFIALIK